MMAATTITAAAAEETIITTAATTAGVMEKPSQQQIQQQQQALKCPRCESTNTKFCYYNNYSLSQPRHFCKSCKRYWTKGGTLRNVPVGGGSRKNKRVRVRRPTSNCSSSSSASNNSSINETNTFISSNESNLNPSATGINGGGGHGAHLINPMLYGLPTNLVPHEVISNGFPFSAYDSHHNHHHHQPQTLGGLGLGFSLAAAAGIFGGGGDHGVHGHGFSTPKQILQDLISNSNSSLASTFHGSCNTTTSTTTTTTTTTSTTTLPTMSMSSLLNSSLQQQQQKFNFHNSLSPYESDLQIKRVGSHGNGEVYTKDDHVKLEKNDHDPNHGQPRLIQSVHEIHDPRQQPHMEASDPSILMWNNNNSNGTSIGGNWLDPNFSSIGSSSVPSLI